MAGGKEITSSIGVHAVDEVDVGPPEVLPHGDELSIERRVPGGRQLVVQRHEFRRVEYYIKIDISSSSYQL